jgi:hypothetical protein
MTVLYSQQTDKREKGKAKNGLLFGESNLETRVDLADTVTKVVAHMHSSGLYILPLKDTLETFAKLTAKYLDSRFKLEYIKGKPRYMRYEMGKFTADTDRMADPCDVEVDKNIREQRYYKTVSAHYQNFCDSLRTMNKYYPCLGKVPEDIQRQREEKALEKTFCAFFKDENIGNLLSNTT